MDRAALGGRGERIATACLEGAGLRVIARNVHVGKDEVDVIALEGETVVFVEVKTRSTPGTRPAEAVTRAKIRNLSRAALVYLNGKNWLDREIRFDVVEILDDGATPRVLHTRDAFLFDSSVLSRTRRG
jgi:putative endonuclease